ncbi:hypothetical protein FHT00_001752 [Sphingomonas insulae]|uniref:Uncharacterized protein n=1 Tax=Sphingomonas insulae TaxID=424800 RepID=A0ABP3T792_9SPHN|nr:hypothetical protein [Sphingomonas insulae]NIJ29805.1 hypothetical protein [Sphingomonas insulae]
MRITKSQIGLAAVVLLAPGGFLLGATLIANHYRKRGETRPPEPPIVP